MRGAHDAAIQRQARGVEVDAHRDCVVVPTRQHMTPGVGPRVRNGQLGQK
jgi:hypothetical protein